MAIWDGRAGGWVGGGGNKLEQNKYRPPENWIPNKLVSGDGSVAAEPTIQPLQRGVQVLHGEFTIKNIEGFLEVTKNGEKIVFDNPPTALLVGGARVTDAKVIYQVAEQTITI